MQYLDHTLSWYPSKILCHISHFTYIGCIECGITFPQNNEEHKWFVDDYREQATLDGMLELYGCIDAQIGDYYVELSKTLT